MPKINHTLSTIEKRKRRVRGKLFGTAARPRVTVARSNQHTYIQAINDEQGVTVGSANDAGLKPKYTGTKTQRATAAAQDLAKQLQAHKITAVVFDRGAYKYHGRVKAIAEALRAAGVTL